jgi:hypothetical protein
MQIRTLALSTALFATASVAFAAGTQLVSRGTATIHGASASSETGFDDGFTGYGAFGGRVGRWGDYTAAVADADGSVWMAAEYIPNLPRTVLANWGTFVGRIVP